MTNEELINNEKYHTCGRCKHDQAYEVSDTGWFILAGIFWPLVYFAAMCMFLGRMFTSALVKFRKIVEEGEKE